MAESKVTNPAPAGLLATNAPRAHSMKANKMKLAINPTIETIFPSGALCLSDIVQDEYFTHTYYGYTRAEAKAEFREMVREFFEQQITAR